MKRKLILTITIAALLCILFAFTVSASNLISFEDYDLSSCQCWVTVIVDEGSEFGLIYFYDDLGGDNFGFYNIEYWDSLLSGFYIYDAESFVSALNDLASAGVILPNGAVYNCCLHSASEQLTALYVEYKTDNNISIYYEGYDAGFSAGKNEGYSEGYVKGTNDGQALGYESGYEEGYYWGEYDGTYSGYEAAGDYIKEWFTLQKLNKYIESDSSDAKEKFEYEFSHNSVALKEAAYNKGETDGLNASGIAKEGILSIVSAPFYFLSGIFNFEIFGVNLFSIISVILTLAVVAFFFKKIKG